MFAEPKWCLELWDGVSMGHFHIFPSFLIASSSLLVAKQIVHVFSMISKVEEAPW